MLLTRHSLPQPPGPLVGLGHGVTESVEETFAHGGGAIVVHRGMIVVVGARAISNDGHVG